MSSRPFKQQINYFSPAIPMQAEWDCGKMSKIYPLAYHNDYEFHFIKQGQGKYIIEGQAYNFRSGHLVIIKPNQIHSRICKRGCRIEKAMIIFPGKWQADFLNKLEFSRGLPNLIYLSDAQALCIEMITNRIIEENARRAKGWEDMIVRLIQEFLLWVNRLKEQQVNPVREKPVRAQLRQYIESHFADLQCNVTSIAKYFGYSRNYVTGLSKEISGMGLKHYLQQYRIIAARRLLESESQLKVEAVARRVGFNKYRNFTRTFLSRTGITASRYRAFYHQDSAK